MRVLWRWGIVIVLLGLSVLAGQLARAQEAADLELFNYDITRPVLFQALNADETPESMALTPHLTVDDPADLPDLIYLAIENNGWSEGAIGLNGADLDPAESYVLLELWERMGNRVLRDDGRGMIFPLEYVDDLSAGTGEEPVPGFRLDLLLDRQRIFQLYRVVEEGGEGLSIWGNQYVRVGLQVEPRLASFVIDPAPVWGDLLLDAHIIALPAITPTTTPTPTVTPTAVP